MRKKLVIKSVAPFEDFTTYTKIDSGNNIKIISPTEFESNLVKQNNDWLYKDFGKIRNFVLELDTMFLDAFLQKPSTTYNHFASWQNNVGTKNNRI